MKRLILQLASFACLCAAASVAFGQSFPYNPTTKQAKDSLRIGPGMTLYIGAGGRMVFESGSSVPTGGGGDGGGGAWGNVVGSLENQADLWGVLGSKQPIHATLTGLSGLTFAANQYAYSTGADTFAIGTITPLSRTFLAAADAAAQRAAIGAGTSNFDGAYGSLSGKPTLGDAAPKNTGTTTGTLAAGDDSRLSDARTPTAHNQAASTISDSTTIGRQLMTAASALDARNSIGAGDGAYEDLSGKPTLFDGAYASLSGKPTIPAAQVQSDWEALTGLGAVLHKPTLFSGAYADLSGKPTLFSGAYADLSGKPTLFDGAYASLSGKPTLGDAAAKNTGSTTGTLAAGDDSRLSDARTPVAHNQAVSTISDATTVGQNLVKLTNPSAIRFLRVNANNTTDLLSASDFLTAIGAGSSGFSGAYADLSGKPTLGDAAAKNTGTTTGTVAAGDDSRFPVSAEKSALAGTAGTPGSGNKYVTDADTRLPLRVADLTALGSYTAASYKGVVAVLASGAAYESASTDGGSTWTWVAKIIGNAAAVKTALSLDQVTNTTDANKPVSSATQTALNLKANTADVLVMTGTPANGKVPMWNTGGTTTWEALTEYDPVVAAIHGIVKSDGTTITAASASDLPYVHTPVNYTDATKTAESAIAALDTALGGKQASGSYLTKATNVVVFPPLVIDALADGMNYGIGFLPAAFTITGYRAVHVGAALSSPSILLKLYHGTDRSSGTAVVTAGTTVTSSTTGTNVITGFDSAACAASSWIWMTTASKSGTTDKLEITFWGVYD